MISKPELPPLRDVIRRHGLFTRKSLGQHFLLDSNLTTKIVRLAGNVSGVNVVEIGPGPGGLTRALLESEAQCVYAVEKDSRCVGALAELAAIAPNRLQILEQDALDYNIPGHVPAPRAIVANLPYNIGTLLLLGWLEDIAQLGSASYRSLTLMFQKEVAMRLVAERDTKAYGRLSVMTQFLCDVQHCFDVPASAFTPPPKVTSTVVRLVPRAKPLYSADKDVLEAVLAAAFGQRRKMLRSSLASLGADTKVWLEKAAIDGTRRAETLSIEEFCRLAQVFPSIIHVQ